MLHQP
jgi:hypothetical protein